MATALRFSSNGHSPECTLTRELDGILHHGRESTGMRSLIAATDLPRRHTSGGFRSSATARTTMSRSITDPGALSMASPISRSRIARAASPTVVKLPKWWGFVVILHGRSGPSSFLASQCFLALPPRNRSRQSLSDTPTPNFWPRRGSASRPPRVRRRSPLRLG